MKKTEIEDGFRLGIDSWSDTSCSGKHYYVDEFVEGKTVTAAGLSSSMDYLKHPPTDNFLYKYVTLYVTTILLDNNNTIYMGDMIEYPLTNLLHRRDKGIHIEITPIIIILMTLVPRLLLSQMVQ